jgi:hypothetical protein
MGFVAIKCMGDIDDKWLLTSDDLGGDYPLWFLGDSDITHFTGNHINQAVRDDISGFEHCSCGFGTWKYGTIRYHALDTVATSLFCGV